jgi:3-methyl-2-oxobutanoate hydroxymethyltransferase
MKMTISTFLKMKQSGNRLVMLTAYDYSSARLADSCGIDGILVGDSLGMVCLGYPTTLQVTLEDMLHHVKAVARGTSQALLVGDMPFLSYQVAVGEAIRNAGRLVQEGGAAAVKLEGGAAVLPQIRGILRAQIPVMGHLGLTPQSVHAFGGYKVQGREPAAASRLMDDARRLADAGVFAIVLECVPEELAREISQAVPVPTIGIGAGSGCDGQILVWHDLLGLSGEFKPRFVKVFADAGAAMREGISAYAAAVRAGEFPGPEHVFHREVGEP